MSKDKNEKPIPKKRGRKPKGGKIVTTNVNTIVKNEIINNVVLHLKCKKSDIQSDLLISELNYNPVLEEVESFSLNNNNKNQNLDLNYYSNYEEKTTNDKKEENNEEKK